MNYLKQQCLDDAKKATDDAWKCQSDNYKKKVDLLRKEHEKLNIRYGEFHEQTKDYESEIVRDDDVLKINVSGHDISVERGVLTQIRGSRLEALFSGRWEEQLQPNKDEPIFLDVNYDAFQMIVNYLKELRTAPPNNPPKYMNSPVTKKERVFLDRLLVLFGLENIICYSTIDDSRILNGLEETRSRSLLKFLEQDDVDGKLELIYRASRDGWRATDFHHKCDYRGPTVTLIKSTGGFVFGGFADTPWTSNGGYKTSEKAFLFALKCYSGLHPTKMKYKDGSSNSQRVVYHMRGYGPTFGGGHDIYVADNANSNKSSHTYTGTTYEHPSGQNSYFLTGSRNFQAEEIEVFAVVPLKYPDLHLRKNTKTKSGCIGYSTKNEPWHEMTFEEFTQDLKEAMYREQKELIASWDQLLELEMKFYQEKTFVDFVISGNVTNTYHGYKETLEK